MKTHSWIIEASKSGAASCGKSRNSPVGGCQGKIQKGELRIKKTSVCRDQGWRVHRVTRWHQPPTGALTRTPSLLAPSQPHNLRASRLHVSCLPQKVATQVLQAYSRAALIPGASALPGTIVQSHGQSCRPGSPAAAARAWQSTRAHLGCYIPLEQTLGCYIPPHTGALP